MPRTNKLPGLCLAIALTGCIPAPSVSPYGRTTSVKPVQGGLAVKGELLAARADSLWLLRGDTIVPLSFAGLRRVEIERHGFTGKRTMIIMATAGVLNGIAMSYACSQYEENSGCGGVLPGVAGLFLGAGALFALSTRSSSKFRFPPARWEEMRPYARFPQGIPDSVRAMGTLAPRPPRS